MTNTFIYDKLNKITKFNEIKFEEFDGFRMAPFFVISYHEVMNGIQSEKNLFLLIVKNILRCFFNDMQYRFSDQLFCKIALFYSHQHAKRKDYVKFMTDVQQILDDSILLSGNNTQIKFNFKKKSFKNLFLLPKWFKQISIIETDTFMRWYLLYKISSAYRWKLLLEENDDIIKQIKGLVTIFDAREYENILTQYVQTKGRKAATLQHGHFAKLFEVEQDYAIQYTGFVSNEMWVWGEYAFRNAVESGIPANKIKCAGYPKINNIINNSIEKKLNMGVILDAGLLSERINESLLDIAIKFAKKNSYFLCIKPHPNDKNDFMSVLGNFKDFTISNDYIFDFAQKVDFSICFASSAYIDLLYVGAPVFRYKKDEFNHGFSRLSDNDSFKDAEDLQQLIEKCDESINCVNKELLLGNLGNVKNVYNKLSKDLFN